ncbi:hypothetical protein E2P81_ATG03049 [Venturia nashicola]|uniref:Uncharacterized protein n=1 Tax=Venturia nashicola TaxID=86259 RepID=A0A4Z1P6U9_9PEZI|nr:hypothetical protein E6O75_ATG03114 [Venturia nashicola]TLD36160.1 hypothetical protein E2P81_ATG03049 [Venturia nashicola]
MANVATSLHTTLVTKVLGSTLEALVTTTATNDIITSSVQAQSTSTKTITHTVLTTLTPSIQTPAPTSDPSSLSTKSTSSLNGTISQNQHHFPTTLVAILVTLLSLALVTTLLILLRRLGYLNVASPNPTTGEDPITVAIRREEQVRRKKDIEEAGGPGSRFYAPQLRHLVQLLGSKEEVRIDVQGQLKKARSWRWGRGMGMSEEEVAKGGADNNNNNGRV